MKPAKKKPAKKSSKSKSLGVAPSKKKTPAKKGRAKRVGNPPVAKEKLSEPNVFKKIKTENLRLTRQLVQKSRLLEIEAALESVRARTMAMQQSDELAEAAQLLYQQFHLLGIKTYTCAFMFIEEEKNRQRGWTVASDGTLLPDFFDFPLKGDPILDQRFQSWKSRQSIHEAELQGKANKRHHAFLVSLLPPEFAQHIVANLPDQVFFYNANFLHGYLFIVNTEPLTPDEGKIAIRFAKVFEQTYIRFLDLQKAEAQAREAQVEAALEKVRSVSLTMQKSSELQNVIVVVFEKLKDLGLKFEDAGISIYQQGTKDTVEWVAAPGQLSAPVVVNLPFSEVDFKESEIFRDFWNLREKGEAMFNKTYSFAEKNKYFTYVGKYNDFSQVPEEVRKFQLEAPGYIVSSVAEKNSGIWVDSWSGEKISNEDFQVLIRVAKVFEQAYTRFLDLQKAEAQTRKAQIETALERVRSRSLAMHKSEELKEVIQVVYEQFNQLNILIEHTGFIVDYKERADMHIWLTDKYASPFEITIPYFDSPHWNSFIEAKEKGKSFFANHLTFDVKNKFYKDLFKWIPSLPEESKRSIFSQPGLAISTVLLENVGLYIENFSGIPYTDEENNTLMRFGNVFQQTYTRFLDLQKAEAQTRESQIQLALERVRARTMAMQHSHELPEAANVLFQQVQSLGMPVWAAGYCIWDENKEAITFWMCSEGVLQPPIKAPTNEDPTFIHFREACQRGENFYVEEIGGEALVSHYRYARKLVGARETFDAIADAGIPIPTFQIFHIAYFAQGFLNFITYEQVPHAWEVFKRFAKVFEQTYTRFLDLQKAEAQAREAQIEAGLERVRSKTMAMHNSQDVGNTVAGLFDELVALGLEKSARCGIGILDESNIMELWTASTNDNGEMILAIGHLDMTLHPLLKGVRKTWSSKKQSFTYELQGEDLLNYFNILNDYPDYHIYIDVKTLPEKIIHNSFYFTDGVIYCFTRNPISEDLAKVVKRFSGVFGQTYKRYLDLRKAEAQAREAQIEAALERVRARTMGMQKSEDLREVAKVLYAQLKELGFQNGIAAINIMDHESGDTDSWSEGLDDGYDLPEKYHVPYFEHSGQRELIMHWKSGTPYATVEIAGQEKKSYDNYYFFHTDFVRVPETTKQLMMQQEVVLFSMAYMQYGALTWTPSPISEEQSIILQRFAKVFEQTYTRFLDLQKAEAQAREAQIEAALERVRSRTMAMQRSEELADVASMLFKQIRELGIETWTTGFNVWLNDNTAYQDFVTNPEGGFIKPYVVDLTQYPVFIEIREAKLRGDDFFVRLEEGDTIKETYQLLMLYAPEQYGKLLQDGFQFPSKQYEHFVFGKTVSLMFITYEPVPEAHDIFKRFGKVFEQTYTRFLDLQRAEAQAREAHIEAALEKVRSRSLAMHKSEELSDVIKVVSDQLQYLKFRFDNVSFVLSSAAEDYDFWFSIPGQQQPHHIHVPYLDNPINNRAREARSKGLTFHADIIDPAASSAWHQHMFDHNQMDFLSAEAKAIVLQGGFARSVAITPNIMLVVGNYASNPYGEEENAIVRRFSIVFEQSYTRFLDLQKAEAQGREAEIQLALERARARTMAMQRTEDLKEVVKVLYEQVRVLGFQWGVASIIIMDSATGDLDWWMEGFADGYELPERYHVPYFDHQGHIQQLEHWKNGSAFSVMEISGREKKSFDQYYFNQTDFAKAPEKTKQLMMQQETALFSMAYMRYGALSWSPTQLTEEQAKILQRFAKVFEQTYTRFLDLQKAEAQAREAQIEAALERVRARTMAMQKSDELTDVAGLLFQQVKELGISTWTTGFNVWSEDNNAYTDYITSPQGGFIEPYTIDASGFSVFKEISDAKKRGEEFLVQYVEGELLKGTYAELSKYADKEQFEKLLESGFEFPLHQYDHFVFLSNISLMFITYDPVPEAHDIFKRFGKVFEQTYTRFLDLQKAEAQAREATIEAALERVRARALGMHSSDDISSTANTVFIELKALGIQPIRCGVGLLSRDTTRAQLYSSTSTNEENILSLIGYVNLTGHPVLEGIYASWISGTDYFPALVGEGMKSYYELLLSGLAVPVPDWAAEEKQYGHFFTCSVGCLYAWSASAYDETEIKILKRFTSIIDLTFRRYLELQKSEASARDAIRQASLDRVRAEIASMRTTKDLERITPLVWKELTIQNIPFIRCGVFIMDEDKEIIHNYLTTPDGKAIAAFQLPYATPGAIGRILKHWQERKIFLDHWDVPAVKEFAIILVERGIFNSVEQYLDTLPKGGFYLHFLPFNQGMLYVGNSTKLKDDEVQLIQSLADAFSTAYARYEDFNRLEAAKQQVDKTLVDLKQTQQQLVQSEKMASLGELTAGIAHEIQNPLNFVNNFSEVSNELLEEMHEEIEKGNVDGAKSIAKDVKQNLEKILHHGKRADGIVKGMLQHSRTGSSQKDLTDLNAMCDEYLRLAYHGLRAKDKSFNARFETDFDPTLPKVNVLPPDIGRAILNLINNAFYAVDEKKKSIVGAYEPTVAVSTKNNGDKIEIRIQDNGVGVPDKVKEKIFQPFFTTKPTGQGTGLGLSLAYDIVTKGHGGKLLISSEDGIGSTFIIELLT